jgi:glycosyltransferase involved in cell wall biosynthesis
MARPDPYSDIPDLDPSRKARAHLNDLIDRGEGHEDIVILDERIQAREAERATETNEMLEEAVIAVPEAREEVLAREARQASPLLETHSERDSVRLLIFTKNIAYRQLGSLPQKRLVELSGLFAEIHVIILSEIGDEPEATVRLTDNVWLYSTESTSWWKSCFDAYRIANEQLVFAGGFRADIVIAEDPFESGVAAYFIAHKYNRPFQVHVLEDIYEPDFKERDPHNVWRLMAAPHVLKRSTCIRTNSEYLRTRVTERHPEHGDRIETLPLYYNLEAWRDTTPTVNLKERYPQFKFIILHISSMSARSHTIEVLHGAAPLLRMYPTIGLVVVGNGPYRLAVEKQVLALGIQSQVAFEPISDEIISYMKSSNVLVHLSEDPEEDTTILEAAAVKLPIIATNSGIAGTLLTDGESAFLCNGADPACVSYRLKSFLNDNLSRTRFAMNAEEAVFERIEQDYMAYLTAYRASVERCV